MTLSEYLSRYASANFCRMHMPGHKGLLSPYDLTETDFSELGEISDAVAESERVVGRAYGVDQVTFLSGGSTLGLLAAIRSLPEGKILVPRATHKSVYAACELFSREPVILDDVCQNGKTAPLSKTAVERAVKQHPDAVALVVTSPTYFGEICDLARVRAALGRRIMIVDAAHGAHFGLRPELPPSAFGDITVLSAHKTLPSLTQSAFGYACPPLRKKFIEAVNMLGSTSPSYLLYSSIEHGVAVARQTDVRPLIEEIVRLPYRVPTDDPLRIVIDAHQTGRSGFAVAGILADSGVIVEFATDRYVVMIASCVDNVYTVSHIRAGLVSMGMSLRPIAAGQTADACGEPTESFLYRGKTERVPLSKAEGRIAANEVGFYPPCQPRIVRGERYNRTLVRQLSGHTTFNVTDGQVLVRK